MRAEPCAGLDVVFVDHAEGAELFVVIVLITNLNVDMLYWTQEGKFAYEAKENVLRLFSQPRSVFPRSSLRRGTKIKEAILWALCGSKEVARKSTSIAQEGVLSACAKS